MSFEEAFFGPGNRLRWSSIQAKSLSKDAAGRIEPFVEDLRRNPDVLVLPRVDETDNTIEWYVLCSSPRFARAARNELRAFLGPSYSDVDQQGAELDPSDPVEAAAIARSGGNAFKLAIPDPTLRNEARERLRLMLDLRTERPVRFASQLRATGRVLRDFEYALLSRDADAASACISELKDSGRIGATNALFMQVRLLAAQEQWTAILAMSEFNSLLAMSRPRRVTEALLRALYATKLQRFEDPNGATQLVRVFRDDFFPRYRDLLRTKAGLAGYEVDVVFLLAAITTEPSDHETAVAIVSKYETTDPRRAYLDALVEHAPMTQPPAGNALVEARSAFASGDVDRAFGLLGTVPASFERIALLVRCARDIGSLAAGAVALKAIDDLGPTDRERFNGTAMLARIHASLSELATNLPSPASSPEPAHEGPPSTWGEWLNRLSAASRWRTAVSVAEIGAREWDFEALASNPSAVAELADLLLVERAEWGQTALRDALPYLVEFILVRGPDPRTKPVLDSLFLAIAVDEQASLPQFTALVRITEARLALGVAADAYAEAVNQLHHAIQLLASPSAADASLEAMDMLISSPCSNPNARQGFIAQLAAFFSRWYRRIDASQWALLRGLGDELGVPVSVPSAEERQDGGADWSMLDGKRIALYSLRESALRRVAAVLGELCPRAQISVFADHVGGAPALRTAASTADIFVIATAAAKHAATNFIADHRPKTRSTLYARGQGSASLLEALRGYLR